MKTLKRILLLVVVVGLAACSTKQTSSIDLSLKWQLIANKFEGKYMSHSQLSIRNNGEKISNAWSLYFNNKPCTLIEEYVTKEGLKVEHVNGDFFRISPTDQFKPLQVNQTIVVDLNSNSPIVKDSDVPSGFYFVMNEEGEKQFYSPEIDYEPIPQDQLRLSEDDIFPMATPKYLFEKNKEMSFIDLKPEQFILPTPQSIESNKGELSITALTTIGGNNTESVHLAMKVLSKEINLLEIKKDASITVSIEPLRHATSKEAYSLIVNDQGVQIKANSLAGVFYASHSLLKLFPVTENGNMIPHVKVEDTPRFEYRGIMLDVARHFQTKDELLKLIDVMSSYKLNTLHFHFSDDEGWRIEIPSLPELVEVGAKRNHTSELGLLPSYGSGAKGVENVSNGYYSKSDFIEILQFANERNVEVIPEVEFPGHARAAIEAMKYRAEQLAAKGKINEAKQYLLHDTKDTSNYLSVQGFNDNTVCLCQESTYAFVEEVTSQFEMMYKEAGVPFTSLHLGGDEVANGVWEGSSKCQEMFEDNILEQAKAYSLQKLSDIGNKYGIHLGFWDDIAGHHTNDFKYVDQNLSLFSWNNEWGTATADRAYKAANGGYKTVLVPVSNLYFDQAYTKNSDDPGFYWGSYTDTYSAFAFLPMDMFKMNMITKRGQEVSLEYLNSRVQLTSKGKQNIKGIEGSLFSETIKKKEDLEYLVFPKLLGLAERAWGPALVDANDTRQAVLEKTNKQWQIFSNLIGQRELNRLALRGVLYRISPVGLKVEEGVLYCNSIFPGQKIILEFIDGET